MFLQPSPKEHNKMTWNFSIFIKIVAVGFKAKIKFSPTHLGISVTFSGASCCVEKVQEVPTPRSDWVPQILCGFRVGGFLGWYFVRNLLV